MNNEIVLSALKSQLSTKKEELKNYEQTTYDPEVSRINEQVLQWLKQNVCEHILSVKAGFDSVSIASHSSRYNTTSLSVDRYWHGSGREQVMRLNSYSSNLRSGDDNALLDLVISGKVAEKFYAIQHELINTWNPLFEKASEPVNKMYSDIGDLEQSINQIQRNIELEAKDAYKKVGFECTLNPRKEILNRWSDEPTTIEDRPHEIRLQTGRSKWDYIYVGSFKVKAINKYHCTLDVTSTNYTNREVKVTMNQYNEFVESVYAWQSTESEKYNSREMQRFEAHCEHVKKVQQATN